jgi:hypothetical protein
MIANVTISRGGYTATVTGPGLNQSVTVSRPAALSVFYVGTQGLPGASSAGIEFAFASASTSWTINHNLGVRPAVALFTVGGVEMMGQVTHTSVNQAVASFNTPQSGFARIT